MFQKYDEYEIILELLKESRHLRELSRKTQITPTTIHRKLTLLVEQNILDVIEEGKNTIYFIRNNFEAKNYIYLSEIYNRIKFIENNSNLRLSLLNLLEITKGNMVIVFGSYVKNTNTLNSDIDIFIETEDKSLKSKIKLIDSKFNVKIGIFDKNTDLGKEIIKNHVILNNVERFYNMKDEKD